MGDVLPPGTRLGRYEIVQRLALGGMAEIYLAKASGLAGFAKHVVLKRILPSHARDPEFVRMFFNEARYAATLDHPNIAHVYDLGEEQGLHYFTMEYLHGEDCRTILRDLQARKLKLPLEHALAIVGAAATGCHFAHELTDEHGGSLGLVHRDVSPSNVVVTYAGAVKMVDFGIAKATNLEDVTAIGVTKGKLAYMAPEQCKSESLDRRVDVYALGVLLYELTTQKRAFYGGNDAAVMWSVVTGTHKPPGEVAPGFPEPLAAIIAKAMNVDRTQRYATARELQQALEAFGREAGVSLSQSALGDWLEKTFGPKVEPWRGSDSKLADGTPSAPGRRITPQPVPVPAALGRQQIFIGEPTATASEETRTQGPTQATPIAAARNAAQAGPPPMPMPMMPAGTPMGLTPVVDGTSPFVRPARWPWIAAAVILAASASAAIAIVVPRLRAEPPAAGPVVLVTERGSTSMEGSGGAEDLGDPPPTPPGDGGVGAALALDAGGKSGQPPRPPRPTGGDPLSLAFSKKQGAAGACFERHSETVVGQPEVILRFVIDTKGVPTTVELLPATVASTPLGRCLVEVGRGARFPTQAQPIAFRIPVSVRRQGGK